MGRHKQHKPRRPRGGNDQPATEWFGTAFHSTKVMNHLDVRQSGNGILIARYCRSARRCCRGSQRSRRN